jgi:hypothetical protein
MHVDVTEADNNSEGILQRNMQRCAISGCEQSQQNALLLDHLVSAAKQRNRHSNPERLSGFEV